MWKPADGNTNDGKQMKNIKTTSNQTITKSHAP